MSELQNEIDIFEMQRGDKMYPGERNIVDAARRVANRNLDLAAKTLGKYMSGMSYFDLLEIADEIVDAALGITDDRE